MEKHIEFFNQTSVSYSEEYDRLTSDGYSFRIRRQKTASLIPQAQNGQKALDVGCGPGIMADTLFQKGYQVFCVDAAPEMISLAQKKYSDKAQFFIGKADKLNFNPESFDLVLAMGLLEYLDQQNAAVLEMNRVLKNKGLAILTFPNKLSPWRLFNKAVLFFLRPARKIFGKQAKNSISHREYTLSSAEKLLEKNGFSIKNSVYYNFKLVPYPFDKKFPKLAVRQSQIFEKLDKTFFKFLGTGFIILAQKNSQG